MTRAYQTNAPTTNRDLISVLHFEAHGGPTQTGLGSNSKAQTQQQMNSTSTFNITIVNIRRGTQSSLEYIGVEPTRSSNTNLPTRTHEHHVPQPHIREIHQTETHATH
jgi:hypothetical protein